MLLHEDMNASLESPSHPMSLGVLADLHNQSREFASQPPVDQGGCIPARCTSRNLHCVVHAFIRNRFPAFIKPDLVVRQRESLHACWVSHTRARISHEVHIRFCSGLPSQSSLMRSEISEKRHFHTFQPFKYIFRKTLGCPTDAGARLGSSAACAVDACIIAKFACCALRACVAAAAACVAALAARTASFNCALLFLYQLEQELDIGTFRSFCFPSWHHWRSHLSNVHAVVVCTGLFCHWAHCLVECHFPPRRGRPQAWYPGP